MGMLQVNTEQIQLMQGFLVYSHRAGRGEDCDVVLTSVFASRHPDLRNEAGKRRLEINERLQVSLMLSKEGMQVMFNTVPSMM